MSLRGFTNKKGYQLRK